MATVSSSPWGKDNFGLHVDWRGFRDAVDTAKDELGNHVQEIANTTVELAMDNTPYERGTNRRSITADYIRAGQSRVVHKGEMPADNTIDLFTTGNAEFSIRIYTQSGYGGWLELGTKRMYARPYIIPAFTRAVEDLKRDLDRCI